MNEGHGQQKVGDWCHTCSLLICDMRPAFCSSSVEHLLLKSPSSLWRLSILRSRQSMYSFFLRRLSCAEIFKDSADEERNTVIG